MTLVPPGSVTGLYHIPLANLPWEATWQHLKDLLRELPDGPCHIEHAEVYPNLGSGWVRVRGERDFWRAYHHLSGLAWSVNGVEENRRCIEADDRNYWQAIPLPEVPPSRPRRRHSNPRTVPELSLDRSAEFGITHHPVKTHLSNSSAANSRRRASESLAVGRGSTGYTNGHVEANYWLYGSTTRRDSSASLPVKPLAPSPLNPLFAYGPAHMGLPQQNTGIMTTQGPLIFGSPLYSTAYGQYFYSIPFQIGPVYPEDSPPHAFYLDPGMQASSMPMGPVTSTPTMMSGVTEARKIIITHLPHAPHASSWSSIMSLVSRAAEPHSPSSTSTSPFRSDLVVSLELSTHQNGTFKGTAFAVLKTEEVARRVIEKLNGRVLEGRELKVRLTKEGVLGRVRARPRDFSANFANEYAGMKDLRQIVDMNLPVREFVPEAVQAEIRIAEKEAEKEKERERKATSDRCSDDSGATVGNGSPLVVDGSSAVEVL